MKRIDIIVHLITNKKLEGNVGIDEGFVYVCP